MIARRALRWTMFAAASLSVLATWSPTATADEPQHRETFRKLLEKGLDAPTPLALEIRLAGPLDEEVETGRTATIAVLSPDAWRLAVDAPEVAFTLARSQEYLYLHVPERDVLIVGEGEAPIGEQCSTLSWAGDNGLWRRFSNIDTGVRSVAVAFESPNRGMLLPMLESLGKVLDASVQYAPAGLAVSLDGRPVVRLSLDETTGRTELLDIAVGRQRLLGRVDAPASIAPPPAAKTILRVDRAELEHGLARGLVRIVELLRERATYGSPRRQDVAGEHGRYLVRDGHRIVLLEGEPYEIGFQHGRFLADDIQATLDSTLHVVGLYYTIERGRWFLDDLRDAADRLERHIPDRYMDELRGVADGAGLPYEDVRLASYFPELFHCSGFAVSGRATKGGVLYHGRVLDYMTEIGLQNRAVLFVVRPEGRIPFVNVGYAGFHGSVSGMNAERISLGEMGGGGEGDWDGVPMTILMRMALETATSLDEAKAVFRDNPRTCEYYYVFADGEDRSAVGVAATPETIEFVGPGESHPRLPTPIDDCVLLSAGSRYDALCDLVRKHYGAIDEQVAMRLMAPPVAMGDSTLHNVLFLPERLELHVADATRNKPAHESKYRRYDLVELLSLFDDERRPLRISAIPYGPRETRGDDEN